MFTSANAQEYEEKGYTVIRKGFSPQVCDLLLNELTGMVAKWDLHKLRKDSKPFVTYEQSNRSSDDWFLTSGDQIRPFFEEEGEEPVVNKIGHALHELHPVFRQLVRSSKIKDILKELKYESPVPIQSMYIGKSAKVGGEVTAHQDSTFLISNPPSVCGIWIALRKATVENGCMFFVNGSHKVQPIDRLFVRDPSDFGKTLFEPPTPPVYNTTGAVAVEADIGDVVIFHGSVVHFSAPNRSSIPRPAYVMHFSEAKCGWHPRNWLQSRFFRPLYGLPFNLPIIDLSKQNADLDRLWDVYMREYGFAVIVGHNVPAKVIQNIRAQSKKFFTKDEKFKRKFIAKGYGGSGFNPFATEAVADVQKTPDPIESFYLSQDSPQYVELDEMMQACYQYRDEVDKNILTPLLRLTARALGLVDENTLVKLHVCHYHSLKLSHYPASNTKPSGREDMDGPRYGAHTDWEGFTIVLQDENDDLENGLEVLLPNGTWVSPGPTIPNSFVVNAGDFIPVWTRGRWISPVHRVVVRDKTRERYSVPYFTGPHLKTTIEPLVDPLLHNEDNGNYTAVNAGEWLNAKISRAKV